MTRTGRNWMLGAWTVILVLNAYELAHDPHGQSWMASLNVVLPAAVLVAVVVDYRRRLPDRQEEGDREAP